MNPDNNVKLPSGNYQGYYWLSNATDPVIIDGQLPEILSTLHSDANPFVIEALLFNAQSGMSCSIKYVDGRHVIVEKKVAEKIADVAARKYDFITLKKYYANRMNGKRLLFFQYWEKQRDPLCAGMEVLQPADFAFVGFDHPTKSKGND